MAKSENSVANGAWVQPISYFATVDKDGAGKFVRVPDMPVDAQKCLGVFDPQGPGAI